MKYQILLSGKKHKNSIINLSSVKLDQMVVKVSCITELKIRGNKWVFQLFFFFFFLI